MIFWMSFFATWAVLLVLLLVGMALSRIFDR